MTDQTHIGALVADLTAMRSHMHESHTILWASLIQ